MHFTHHFFFWNVENARVRTPPNVEFSTFFFLTGSLNNMSSLSWKNYSIFVSIKELHYSLRGERQWRAMLSKMFLRYNTHWSRCIRYIITIPSSSPEQIPRGGNQGSKQPPQQFPDRDLLHIRDIPRPPVPLHAGQEPEEQLRQRIYLPWVTSDDDDIRQMFLEFPSGENGI